MKKLILFSIFMASAYFTFNASAQKRSLVSSEEVTYIDGAKIHVTCDLYSDGSFEGRVSINHSGCPKIRVKWKFFNNDAEYLKHIPDHIEEGDYSTCNQSRNFFKKSRVSEEMAKKIDSITIHVMDIKW